MKAYDTTGREYTPPVGPRPDDADLIEQYWRRGYLQTDDTSITGEFYIPDGYVRVYIEDEGVVMSQAADYRAFRTARRGRVGDMTISRADIAALPAIVAKAQADHARWEAGKAARAEEVRAAAERNRIAEEKKSAIEALRREHPEWWTTRRVRVSCDPDTNWGETSREILEPVLNETGKIEMERRGLL